MRLWLSRHEEELVGGGPCQVDHQSVEEKWAGRHGEGVARLSEAFKGL